MHKLQFKIGMRAMERNEIQLLNELRSILFASLDLESEDFQFEDVVLQMLNHLKKSIGAKEISLYAYHFLKGELFLDISTNISFCQKELNVCKGQLEQQLKQCTLRKSYEWQKGCVVIPIRRVEEMVSFLVIKKMNHCPLRIQGDVLTDICLKLFGETHKISDIISEKQRYRQLSRVTAKFHSSMDMDDVLGEIIDTLQQVYPTYVYTLLLSHDNHHNGILPIEDLGYNSGNLAAMQAYVTGEIQLEDSIDGKYSTLYAPLNGKQGIYGVLKVVSTDMHIFPKSEVAFIILLANTAGSAIENAQLYQQSKRLISDLQLINEMSHKLNSNLRLSEIMNYLKEQIRESFKTEAFGFALYTKNGDYKMLQGSAEWLVDEEFAIYVEYIKEKIDKEKEAIFLGDLQLKDSGVKQFRSVMAVPMVHSGVIKGFSLVMHEEPYCFSFEMFKLLQSLIHHSTLAFTNSILHEELEKMVITDHLTKLYSRSFFDKKLSESMSSDPEGVFIMVDIDNFKSINDTYGHQVGDEILVQVSSIIRKCIRSNDTAARWGGEEIAVYLPKVNLETGIAIAERIRQCVVKETTPCVSISCGVSHWNIAREDSIQALFKRADVALYEAKTSGKNKVLIG